MKGTLKLLVLFLVTSSLQAASITDEINSSENGLMPKIELTNLEPGEKIYIRFWDYGDNVSGTFGICAVQNTNGVSIAQK